MGADWNGTWVAPDLGGARFDHTTQQIAAVSRAPGQLDVFTIGFDDRVWTAWWDGTWHPWFPLPGGARFNHKTQHVTVVSRGPGNLDVFVIGLDNRIWTAWWDGAWHDFFAPDLGGARFDHQKQHVAAVSRRPGQIDLFVLGFDNRLWTAWWDGVWHQWFAPDLGGARFDHGTQQLAAVSRGAGNLDVFAIGSDRRVWVAGWEGSWRPWFALPGGARFDPARQQLAVDSRRPGHIDVFVLGSDNKLWTTWWDGTWHDFFAPNLGGATFDHRFQQVTAVSRTADQIDVFVLGFDDQLWSAFWFGSWHGWFTPVPDRPERFPHQIQHVAVVSRAPMNLDAFVLGFDNRLWTTWWGEHAFNPVTLNVSFNANGTTVPITAKLDVKASRGVVRETRWGVTKNGAPVPGTGDTIPAGVAFERLVGIGDPGSYRIDVSRTGFTAPGREETLRKQFVVEARQPGGAPPPPPPRIDAVFSGSITQAKFTVSGSNFLPNRDVEVRFVDANAGLGVVTRRQTLRPRPDGTIGTVIEGDLTGMALNALGFATAAISATDFRPDPSDLTRTLWSNTVRIDFRG